jgi:hypothetical protein
MSSSIIFAGGEIRKLSLKPRTMPLGDPRCCRGVCGLGDGPKIILRKDWPQAGADLSDEVTEILDQDGLSLCHSFAGTQAIPVLHLGHGEDAAQHGQGPRRGAAALGRGTQTVGGRARGHAHRIRQDAGRHRETLYRSQRQAAYVERNSFRSSEKNKRTE